MIENSYPVLLGIYLLLIDRVPSNIMFTSE